MGVVLIKKVLLAVVLLLSGIFLLGVLLATFEDPQAARKREQQRSLDAMCEQMMADSALGAERRQTRAICDEARAKQRR
jgi:hypothetical protein